MDVVLLEYVLVVIGKFCRIAKVIGFSGTERRIMEKGRLCLSLYKDDKIVFTDCETKEVLGEITQNEKSPYMYVRLVFNCSKKLAITREKI